jgi:hypothetical protein
VAAALPNAPQRSTEARSEALHEVKGVRTASGLDIMPLGKDRCRVFWAGRMYVLERARVEVRPGGRRQRNMIRWLVGYVGGVLHAFLVAILEERPAWFEIAEGLHVWLDRVIFRQGVEFATWWFRVLDVKVGRV